MKRSAQKGNATAYRFTACKAGNSLVYHSLKNRCCKICFCRTFVDKRLNIGLCKHTAACGDRIDLFVVFGFAVKSLCVGLQKGSHLVDKRACTSGTDAVHTLLKTAGKINDFSILAAELNGNISIWHYGLQGGGNGDNLLHKPDAQRFAEIYRAGAGNLYFEQAISDRFFCVFHKLRKGSLRVSLMAAVFSVNYIIIIIKYDQLDGG